jgi:tetratricopeptide (TPR) repeat protein
VAGPYRALTEISRGLWSWRYLARIWPSQFRQPLAYTLLTQAEALCALHRETQALSPAAEAVAIYQVLAAEKPRRFTPGLADALDRQSSLLAASGRLAEAEKAIAVAVRLYRNLVPAASGDYLPGLADALTRQAEWLLDMGQDSAALAPASEAADICQDRLSRDELPPCAAQTLLLTGRLRPDRLATARQPGHWPGVATSRRPRPAGSGGISGPPGQGHLPGGRRRSPRSMADRNRR